MQKITKTRSKCKNKIHVVFKFMKIANIESNIAENSQKISQNKTFQFKKLTNDG